MSQKVQTLWTFQTLLVNEFPYRTTVAYNDNRGWEIIELCERVFPLEDKAAKIRDRYQNLITLATKTIMSPSDFGMVVLDTEMRGGDSSSSVALPSTTRPSAPDPIASAPEPAVVVQQSTDGGRDVPESVALQPTRDAVTVAGVHVAKD